MQYEWTVHNLIYYATGLAKLIFPNNDRIRELNEKTESTGIGSTIFDDRKSGHGKASDIMIATYTIASPISATIDMIIANR